MERQRGVGAGPSDDEDLVNLRNFLGRNADTTYSSVVSVRRLMPLGLQFSVELVSTDGKQSYTFESQFTGRAHTRMLLMEMIRTLGECPSWTHGGFVFGCDEGENLDDLIPEVFKLLRSSRSLVSVDLELEPFCHRHLPILVAENPTLENLILSPGDAASHPIDTEAIAKCFWRNNVLRYCTLGVNYTVTEQAWETMLRPFTASTEEANVALKELVLEIYCYSPCQEAIANLVRFNTTLEKLEFRPLYSAFGQFRSVAEALVVNYTLQEFGCVWTDHAHLKELVDVLIPGIFDRSANAHLKTLKLYHSVEVIGDRLFEAEYYCMKEVCRMLELNTTLEHVEVFPMAWIKSWITRDDRDVILNHRGILESAVREKLRSNTSLQSLTLGFWKMRRVRGEWQMSYNRGGPCLAMRVQTAEYDVKVKMRR